MFHRSRLRELARSAHYGVTGSLPPGLRRQYLHAFKLRRIGRFDQPTTFNEKVNWRILNDRRPDLIDACDKDAMKRVARSRVDADRLAIPETLWAGTDVSTIPDSVIEQQWVAKPNHSSGQVVFGPRSRDELRVATRGWLKNRLADQLGEWGYSRARRLILLEERLPGDTVPIDYKFFVFDGVPRMVQVSVDRFGDDTEMFYDMNWKPVGVQGGKPASGAVLRPSKFDEMKQLASELAAGWDFMRIDLYQIGDQVWFGEFSPYPAGGLDRFQPSEFDQVLGAWWDLPPVDQVRQGQGPVPAAPALRMAA